MNSSMVFFRMADDLVKIRTKRFWGGKILGIIWFSGGTEGEEEWSIIANRVLDYLGSLA